METIKYRGVEIETYKDTCYEENPNEWDNAIQLVSYHRDFWIESDITSEEEIQSFYQGEKVELSKTYWIFGVEAYIHSGVHLSLSNTGNYPDRQWDVSHVGAILVSKKECRLSKSAKARAVDQLETWNNILSGQIYGYSSKAGDCGGFIGDCDYMIEEAKSEVDYYIKEKRSLHCKKLKAQILNSVPIEARTSFQL